MSEEQLPLIFPRNRRVHRDDPPSSYRAEADNATRVNAQREIVLAAVREFPGHSTREIAERFGLDLYLVRRRSTELGQVRAIDRTKQGSDDLRLWPKGQAPDGLEIYDEQQPTRGPSLVKLDLELAASHRRMKERQR